MAIVNHTGVISSNETWAAADEHHIADGFVSLESGAVVTIEAGVTAYVDGDYTFLWGTSNNEQIDYNGTEANKITFMADPTNFPKPWRSDYRGIIANGSRHDMDWLVVKHADFFARIRPPADNTATWIHINNCASIHNAACFENNGGGITQTQADFLTIDGLYVENCSYFMQFGAFGFTGANAWKNICLHSVDARSNPLNSAYSYKFDIENFMNADSVGFDWFEMVARNAGKLFEINLSGLFITGTFQGVPNMEILNIFYRAVNPIVIENSVFDHFYQLRQGSQQGLPVTIQYCDFIEAEYASISYYSNVPTLIIDHCYFKNCNRSDYVGATGDGPRPTPAVWYDQDNAYEPANIQPSPIFPLDVENVSEGTPGANSITITFDAKDGAGAAPKKLLGIPFIRYGTISGSLDHEAGIAPRGATERAKAFAKWDTSKGVFATTGHSVTLSNLKPGTTYYYTCCFVGPLGRIAEGSEGSFITAAAGGVRPGEPGLVPLGVKQIGW